MTIPYASATSGMKARQEITRILQHFGCEQVGFMDEFENKAVLLAFTHRGRSVQLRASAQGWANAWLRENPWNGRRQLSRDQWNEKALKQGMIAVNSMLRDWIKGQITAVECGILEFDAVFMPHMLLENGQTVMERARSQGLLPAPEEDDG